MEFNKDLFVNIFIVSFLSKSLLADSLESICFEEHFKKHFLGHLNEEHFGEHFQLEDILREYATSMYYCVMNAFRNSFC